MRIAINARWHEVPSEVEAISYERVVELAATGRAAMHTVTYSAKGVGGELCAGQSVTLVDGMIFAAVVTDNA